MDINWINTGLSAMVIFVATIVHGIAGFGLAQVSMGIMPLFRSPASASAIFSAFFGILMLYRVGSLAVSGEMTVPRLVEAAAALPALFLGAWLGIKIYELIPEDVFSWIVLVMLTINAFVLLFTS